MPSLGGENDIIKSIALLPVVLISCEKELDFKYHDIDPITVIEGVLTLDGPLIATTLTMPMDEPMDHTRLTDASVELITESVCGRSIS